MYAPESLSKQYISELMNWEEQELRGRERELEIRGRFIIVGEEMRREARLKND